MTVASETSRITYTGSNVVLPYVVPFYFLADTHLKVVVTDPITGAGKTLLLNSDYSVSGAGSLSGGQVVLFVPPTSSKKVTIFRDPDRYQTTDYPEGDKFPAESHERALDKLTMLAQRFYDMAIRSLRLNDSDVSGASLVLPPPKANTMLAWGPDGKTLVNVFPVVAQLDQVTGDLVFYSLDDNNEQRIRGKFNGSPVWNRVLFEGDPGRGGVTDVGAVPPSDGVVSSFTAYGEGMSSVSSDCCFIRIEASSNSYARVISGKNGVANYVPLKLNVGGADVVTYSPASSTLGNMTASVSNAAGQLAYVLSNINANALSGSSVQLQSNAGLLTINKLSTASGLAGGGSVYNAGGSLYIGTTDTGQLLLITNNALAASLDSAGNFLLNKAAGGLGYGAGAGGSVTQTTSKTTAVTLNRPCGQITMNNAALASGASATFSLTNSLITTTDCLVANTTIYASYRAEVLYTTTGSAGIRVTNITAGSLSEALLIQFAIIKGSNS